jgi:hypothetical protein
MTGYFNGPLLQDATEVVPKACAWFNSQPCSHYPKSTWTLMSSRLYEVAFTEIQH